MTKNNTLLPIRWGLNEWVGAMGDLGTFLPLFIALVALNGLPPVQSLICIGVVYIVSSLYFRIPTPVQPLKAMAAIAIAQGLAMSLLSAGGILMGCILLVLALTGSIEWLMRFFTRPIVKGIQLGVGLMLVKTGIVLLATTGHPESAADNGLMLTFPEWSNFLPALLLLVLPQLPLTLGNAVFAVSDVGRDYFGAHARRATPRKLATSLGLANLFIGAVGGLPVCHGSGGLTAHYRFGARTAGASLIMGVTCILLAVTFPKGFLDILRYIPPWLLGVMVIYVGICHILLLKALRARQALALLMGLMGLATSNLAYPLAFGLVVELLISRYQRNRSDLRRLQVGLEHLPPG